MKENEENSYCKQNPDMFNHLCDIVNNHNRTYGKIITKTDESQLCNWIYEVTNYILTEDYSLKLRCYWIMNNMHDFPICQNPNCRKKITDPKQFIDKTIGFRKFCCRQCAVEYESINPQYSGETVLKKYLLKHALPDFNSYKDALQWLIDTFPFKYHDILYTNQFKPILDDIMLKTEFVHVNANFSTKCYCYLHDFSEMPHCKNCGKTMNINVYHVTKGFKLYCSAHCAAIAEDTQNAKHKTNLERYGDEEYVRTKRFDKQSKMTCLDKYGIDRYTQSQTHKNNIHNIASRMAARCYMTKKRNNSFHVSKPEHEIRQKLIDCFGESDVIAQYKEERYPFVCDFYIKSLDTFIECNFHWTHGSHWFDENNAEDVKKLDTWKSKQTKYYRIAVSVWTNKDVRKRMTAIQNNLNYIVFWTQCEAEQWIEQHCAVGK